MVLSEPVGELDKNGATLGAKMPKLQCAIFGLSMTVDNCELLEMSKERQEGNTSDEKRSYGHRRA